jgi:hypothetical protein
MMNDRSADAIEPARAVRRITRLALQDFRSYAALTIETDADIVALSGENGVGKTNQYCRKSINVGSPAGPCGFAGRDPWVIRRLLSGERGISRKRLGRGLCRHSRKSRR